MVIASTVFMRFARKWWRPTQSLLAPRPGRRIVAGRAEKMIGPVFGILMALTLLSCTSRKSGQSDEAQAQEFERVIATQDRANRYLQKEVVPKLTSCWSHLQGTGTIAMQIGYRRDGDHWAPAKSDIRTSTLPTGQEELALRCLQEAIRNTAFEVEKSDGEAREFLVNWTFPVPWPKDIKEVALRMSINPGGGGGCGGPEAPAPACFDCGFIPFIGFSYCKKTCAGYSNCTAQSNGCSLGPITPKCVTVSPFGNQRGIVMY